MRGPRTMDPCVVLITASSPHEAVRLASTLVEERLAACVNVVGGIGSTYRWQGSVEHAEEWLLVAKTALHLVEALTARVQALHSYTVPEIIALPIVGGSPAYLSWLAESVSQPDLPSQQP